VLSAFPISAVRCCKCKTSIHVYSFQDFFSKSYTVVRLINVPILELQVLKQFCKCLDWKCVKFW